MGQPGCNNVNPTYGSTCLDESFLSCNLCHNSIPRLDKFDMRPKACTCRYFGQKEKVGLIGSNGCETYKKK